MSCKILTFVSYRPIDASFGLLLKTQLHVVHQVLECLLFRKFMSVFKGLFFFYNSLCENPNSVLSIFVKQYLL